MQDSDYDNALRAIREGRMLSSWQKGAVHAAKRSGYRWSEFQREIDKQIRNGKPSSYYY